MDSYFSYLRTYSHELGSRILEMYPPVQGPDDPLAPEIATLLRRPLPAQALTISGLAKTLLTKRSVRIVGECGTGKTLMSMGAAHTHAKGKPYTAIAMCPPHLVYKWAREVFLTIPRARVFVIYDLRNGGDRVLRLWGKTLRRRSQKSRFTWARRVALAEQWLPRPKKLHPYPEVRFAASHPR